MAVGEWKAQLSLRVRQALRAEMEAFAGRERRKLGNVGEVLLEWGVEQLKAAGSLERLLKYKIRTAEGEGELTQRARRTEAQRTQRRGKNKTHG